MPLKVDVGQSVILQSSQCAPVRRSVILQAFKSIVQRDLAGVETRLKQSSLMNYVVAKFAFLILKEHHHERSTKLVSASKQQMN